MRTLFGPSTRPVQQPLSNLGATIARNLLLFDKATPAPAPTVHPVIRAQLALLRDLNRRQGATSFVMLVMIAVGALLFWSACNLAGTELNKAITRIIGY